MKIVSEGEPTPTWYLPVRYRDYNQSCECYFMLWAWLALLIYIIYDVLLIIWRDLINFTRILKRVKLNNWKEDKYSLRDWNDNKC